VGDGAPAFTVVFRTEAALLSAATRGHIGLMEAYFDQDVDVEGDFGAALAAGMASGYDQQAGALNGIENGLHELRHSNRDPARAKANARAHYGLGTALYRLSPVAGRPVDDVHLRLLA
jgi:cyclopropane-fatty-acyl-phospholipid synthase